MPVRLIILRFIVPLLLGAFSSLAQDLNSVGQGEAVKITGGLSANQIIYLSDQESTRAPYNYYLGGQLALNIYGMQLPFSFTYSNQQSNFRQPFNQFALNPTYKWLSGHFGYASVNYSPYTVNGHIFLGGALDLAPSDKWEVGLLVGRLQKAVVADSTSGGELSAYKRTGYGFKIKYGNQNDYVKIILFKSSDDINSLPMDTSTIMPEENLVTSISFGKMLAKKILIQAEYAASALSRNLFSEESQGPGHLLANLPGLFQTRTSSEFYDAYNALISYQCKRYSIGLRYEKVGADYRTHGAYYFNNNFYNVTLNSNQSLFSDRVKILLNIGLQEDDPANLKMSRTTRFVGSANIGIVPSEKLNISVGYSNFSTFTNINREFLDVSFLTPFDQIDTLNYFQISQNSTLNLNYVLARSQRAQHLITANINVLETRDFQSDSKQTTSSVFLTFNSGYQVSLVQSGLNFSTMINVQRDSNPISGTMVFGPSVAVSKSYFNRKLLTSAAFAWNRTAGKNFTGNSLSLRANGSYRLGDHHNFQASIIGISRQMNRELNRTTSDFTITAGYNFTF